MVILRTVNVDKIDKKRNAMDSYWKNLNAFTVPPEFEKRSRKSSSVTFSLEEKTSSY